jgi:hypothetical protein
MMHFATCGSRYLRHIPVLVKLFAACVLVLLAAGVLTTAAEARGRFGNEERINKIQAIAERGPNGERLFLGYKTSTFSIVAPAYMSDDGYVIGVEGDSGRYFELDAQKITDMQKKRQLPTPLPTYHIDWVEWAAGFMLWALLPFIGLWAYISTKRGAKATAAARDFYKVGGLIKIGYSHFLGVVPRAGTAIELSPDGFRGPWTEEQTVPWHAVVGFRKYESQGMNYLTVKLTDEISKTIVRTGLRKIAQVTNPNSVTIPLSKIAVHADAFEDLFQRHLDAARMTTPTQAAVEAVPKAATLTI